MREVFATILQSNGQLEKWDKIGLSGDSANKRQLEEVLADYTACVDWPACNYYKELMEMNPDAKVLLNCRDPEKW